MNDSNVESSPLVSIGVPVFNEEQYLDATLRSLVSQTYDRLEIIISDNCSTDKTPEICQKYQADSAKIIYNKMDENRGPAANFNKVLELAKGEYFMWASGHDLWEPTFIENCVSAYKNHKDAVLVFGSSVWIDEQGDKLEREFGFSDTRGQKAIPRYITIFWGRMNPILGLIKKSALESGAMKNLVGTDLVILSDLSLQGEFVFAEGAKWSRRDFRMEQEYSEKIKRYKTDNYGLTGKSLVTKLFPLLQLPIELTKVVWKSKVRGAEKFLLLLILFVMFPFRYLVGKYFQ